MTKYPAYVFTDKRETYCFSCIAIIEINSDTLRMFNYFSHLKNQTKMEISKHQKPLFSVYFNRKNIILLIIFFLSINLLTLCLVINQSSFALSKTLQTQHQLQFRTLSYISKLLKFILLNNDSNFNSQMTMKMMICP